MDNLNIEKIHFTNALKYFSKNKNILDSLNDLMNKASNNKVSIEDTYCYSTIMDSIDLTMGCSTPFEGTFYVALMPDKDIENNNKTVVGFVTIILTDTFDLYTQKSTSNIKVDDSIYCISGTGVDSQYRNNGIWSKLLNIVIEDFPTVDIHLSVFAGHIEALASYKKIGFVEDQELEDREDPIKHTAIVRYKKT
jgi:ribosomal protein S18 acetylase RimI-like enzyme